MNRSPYFARVSYISQLLVLLTLLLAGFYSLNAETVPHIDYFDLVCDAVMVIIILFFTYFLSKNGNPSAGRDTLLLGFSLLYISLVIDVIDEVFINPDTLKNIGENLFQILGYCIIFIGISKWLNYNNCLQNELKQLSNTDALTGILNRRSFLKAATKEINRSKRYQYDLSLILIDIDHFKKVNDELGHNAGDKTLIDFASIIQHQLREDDLFCRWGGEEFILLFPKSNEWKCKMIAEKLRAIVEKTPIYYQDNKALHVTASFGCAILNNPNELLGNFIDRADKALYKAKRHGRNRTAFAPPARQKSVEQIARGYIRFQPPSLS